QSAIPPPAQFVEPRHKSSKVCLVQRRLGAAHQDGDPLHPLALLRPRQERPRYRRAAEQREEFAPLHSITSSARARSEGGTSRLRALAATRLKTSSNLVGCSTGRCAGFAPRRILST